MNISFIIKGEEGGTEEPTVKLFMRVSSGAPVPIVRTIILFDDDLDESEKFNANCRNIEQRVFAHIISKILAPFDNPESLVAWYATVEFTSTILPWRFIPRQILEEARGGNCVVLTAEIILEKLGTRQRDLGDGSRFLMQSGPAIPCFLLGELHRNPSTISLVRERISEKTTYYLEQLQFLPSVVKTVQNTIDQIDGPSLKEHESSIGRNPNAFIRMWCNYFRNDGLDLSLFRP